MKTTTLLTALTIATLALVAYGQTNKAEIESFPESSPQAMEALVTVSNLHRQFTNRLFATKDEVKFYAKADPTSLSDLEISHSKSNGLVIRNAWGPSPAQTNLSIYLNDSQSLKLLPSAAVSTNFVTNIFTHPHVTVSQLPEGTVIARLNGEIIERGGMTTNFNELMVITTVLRQEVLTFDWNGPRSVTNEVPVSSTRKLKVQVWADKP